MGLMEISLLYTCVLDVQDLGLGCQVSKLDSFFGLGVRRLSNTSLVGDEEDRCYLSWLALDMSTQSSRIHNVNGELGLD